MFAYAENYAFKKSDLTARLSDFQDGIFLVWDLVPLPQFTKYSAGGCQLVDDLREARVAWEPGRLPAEPSDPLYCDFVPAWMPTTGHRVEEEVGEVVATDTKPEQDLCRRVRGDDGPVAIQHVSRIGPPTLDDLSELVGLAADEIRHGGRVDSRELVQMPTLAMAESHCRTDCVEHRVRHLDVPALFQPGVPGHAYASQIRYLFPSQTRRVTPSC